MTAPKLKTSVLSVAFPLWMASGAIYLKTTVHENGFLHQKRAAKFIQNLWRTFSYLLHAI
jgi:hypothetical protein